MNYEAYRFYLMQEKIPIIMTDKGFSEENIAEIMEAVVAEYVVYGND
jgi:hypothetical protein